jgi:DNA-binding beta-propeller fold protein YncE
MKRKTSLETLLFAAMSITQLAAQTQSSTPVGRLPDGGFLLNNRWILRPAGTQVPVDTLPMATAATANGKFLLVLNCGFHQPSLSVIDIARHREIGRTRVPDAWLGLTISKAQNRVYVGGGGKAVVYELSLNPEIGALEQTREFPIVPDINNKGVSFAGDVTLSPDDRVLYVADLHGDSIAMIDVASGKLINRWKSGARPYRLLLDGKSLLVTSWATDSIYQYDAQTGAEMSVTAVGPHATDMLIVKSTAAGRREQKDDDDDKRAEERAYPARLFVTAANTNRVYSFGIDAEEHLTALETINTSLTPRQPVGMTPSALAYDERKKHLYIACSDANAVVVADISRPETKVLGFVPTGWYPTAVSVLKDGQVTIVNGKAGGSKPNPNGPNPTHESFSQHDMKALASGESPVQYVGIIQNGSVSFVAPFADAALKQFTKTVIADSPYRDTMLDAKNDSEQTAFFTRTGDHASPIQHVIYIIKENRTYDQVLGDMEKGNGDKSLNLFGEEVTPNLHQLAREYMLYDNFYENADVSMDGHHWAMAAISPDSITKLWESSYAGRSAIGFDPAKDAPPAGYIWNNAAKAGVKVRDYGGLWVANLPPPAAKSGPQIKTVLDKGLATITDMNYRTFDLDLSDVDRAHEFLREWKQFDERGDTPQLLIMTMGNDHTAGAAPGKHTPFAYVADNDQGIGTLVDGVSHSRLWSSTAIFIIEDDSQDGPDHIDSHRAPAWVISPYTRRGVVDSTMYNQTSILRTIEHITGMPPMTYFDASAPLMFGTFSRTPDATPFTVLSPRVSLTDVNPRNGPGAKESSRLDFSAPDLVDDQELNALIWHAVKKGDPPAPTRSVFGR